MIELVVGIDIAKKKHEICVKDNRGKTLLSSLHIRNTWSDVKRLLENIDRLKRRYGVSKVVFGMESTGVYHLPLYYALISSGQQVRLYNPIQSSGYRRLEIRKTSTDKIDVAIIADMLNYGEPPITEKLAPTYIELRELCRTRHRTVEKITIVKNQIHKCLDMVWPNYDRLFSNPFGTASLTLLKRYSTPSRVRKASFEDLYQLLKSASMSQIDMLQAQKIYEHTEDVLTVPELEDAIRIEIKTLISQLELLTQNKLRLERKIESVMRKVDTKLTTIPGISNVLAAVIIGEIGDINRFSSYRKLVAYAGLDPSTKQSGRWTCSSGKISKRGSPLLRHALYIAANIARQCDETFEAYFKKKRTQGKHFNVAVIATAAKMTRVVYYILKENKEYQKMTEV